MPGLINVTYPDYLANSLKLSGKDFEKEIRMSSIVKLFELSKISSGMAAKVLGLSRLEFLDGIASYKVSFLDYSDIDDLENDIANA